MKLRNYVLALDVGLSATGVVVWLEQQQRIVYADCIRTEATPRKKRKVYVSEDNARRYRELASALAKVIRKWRITVVFAEMPTGASRNVRGACAMASASAVVVTVCYLLGARLLEVRPKEVKEVSASSRSVSKEQVIAAAKKIFGKVIPEGKDAEHIADACMCLKVAQEKYSYD